MIIIKNNAILMNQINVHDINSIIIIKNNSIIVKKLPKIVN